MPAGAPGLMPLSWPRQASDSAPAPPAAPRRSRPPGCAGVGPTLSLHSLPWSETLAAFRDTGALVRPGGCFLFRVNASDDIHHGAGQGVELDPGFFRVPAGMVSHSEP